MAKRFQFAIILTMNAQIPQSGYFIGAYAASPAGDRWDPQLEAAYYRGLREIELMRGLEHPFYGELHAFDSAWFLTQVRSDWDFVLTCIPGTMNHLGKNPQFGLASRASEGRDAAIQFIRRARDAVHLLNDALRRPAVTSVLVHSAPSGLASDTGIPGQKDSAFDVFSDSLSQILSWDWAGAQVLVEHCDSPQIDWPPIKGFLEIEQELAAIEAARGSRTASGMLINWGRSTLERRDKNAAVDHLRRASQRGLLSGLIFSGVCDVADPDYGAWRDSHAPFSDQRPTSMMDKAATIAALEAAGKPAVLGFKIQALPRSLQVMERLELLRSSVEFLDRCRRMAS